MTKTTNRLLSGLRIAGTVFSLSIAFSAGAWMDEWAPDFESTPIAVRELPKESVSDFVNTVEDDSGIAFGVTRGRGIVSYCKAYDISQGYGLDLNGDDFEDHVFLIPSNACGLGALLCEVHFIVSNGAKGWKHTVMDGFGVNASDLVKVAGKTYFRHSYFFRSFEKSDHNHWVFQVFSFKADGSVECGNDDFGEFFPAATIFYERPRFKRIELTEMDLKEIADETKPRSSHANEE
ncbi:MAG: hypothetical protein ILM98_14250 [Kiritimatiellae bacterium]|nr:hypothetical protein [Kiritimatiellia bacterium]